MLHGDDDQPHLIVVATPFREFLQQEEVRRAAGVRERLEVLSELVDEEKNRRDCRKPRDQPADLANGGLLTSALHLRPEIADRCADLRQRARLKGVRSREVLGTGVERSEDRRDNGLALRCG
jgi:hypothetical protein